MILNRINKLLTALHMPKIPAGAQKATGGKLDEDNTFTIVTTTPAHDILDHIDRHLGIITRFHLDGTLAPVGERVRRLERHHYLHTSPPYFHIDAEAENLGVTSS